MFGGSKKKEKQAKEAELAKLKAERDELTANLGLKMETGIPGQPDAENIVLKNIDKRVEELEVELGGSGDTK